MFVNNSKQHLNKITTHRLIAECKVLSAAQTSCGPERAGLKSPGHHTVLNCTACSAGTAVVAKRGSSQNVASAKKNREKQREKTTEAKAGEHQEAKTRDKSYRCPVQIHYTLSANHARFHEREQPYSDKTKPCPPELRQ